jgi:hypothetical protein
MRVKPQPLAQVAHTGEGRLARVLPMIGLNQRSTNHSTRAPPRAPPPKFPAWSHAAARACAGAVSIVAINPPQLACTSAIVQPPTKKSAVRSFRCEAPSSGHAADRQKAVADAPSASQVRRRSLTSTTGVQRNIKAGGSAKSASMRAISSTETPALLSRNGSAVPANPTYIPRGKTSKPKAQGVGHRRGSHMLKRAYQFGDCASRTIKCVSFRSACMNFAWAADIVGGPPICGGWRTADENQQHICSG